MKVGIAYSGGGARGIAHIGMLKALEEEDVKVSQISGASAGAIVGVLHAAGYPADEIYEIIRSTNFIKIMKPAFNWRGLLKLESVGNYLKEFVRDDFDSLNIPFTVSATDVKKGKVKYFSKGKLIKPVLASCSIPVVFDPVRINRNFYIDGGILDNLPIKPIKKDSDFLIGMHCNPISVSDMPNNWKDLMERSLLMAVSSATYLKKKKCDAFWEPPTLSRFKVFDYKKSKDLFNIGYDYAKVQIENGALKKLKQLNEVH